MSLVGEDAFALESFPFGPVENGTSILLTAEDEAVLQTIFYRMLAPAEDERSVVLATERSGRSIRQALNRAQSGSGTRSSVLACEGSSAGDDIRTVDDLADLTRLGMDFSSLIAESQQQSARFRSGILLCSTICGEVEDTRSVYRLLNSNFLSELRRGDGIGVCALDVSADIGADTNSIVAGMKTSFTAHVDVEKTGANEATLTLSGLPDADETVTVSL